MGHADRRGLELAEPTRDGAPLQGAFRSRPTKARTHYAGPDTLVSTIENSLVASERNLTALAGHQRVREIRMFFQHAGDHEFIGTVEEITGRRYGLS